MVHEARPLVVEAGPVQSSLALRVLLIDVDARHPEQQLHTLHTVASLAEGDERCLAEVVLLVEQDPGRLQQVTNHVVVVGVVQGGVSSIVLSIYQDPWRLQQSGDSFRVTHFRGVLSVDIGHVQGGVPVVIPHVDQDTLGVEQEGHYSVLAVLPGAEGHCNVQGRVPVVVPRVDLDALCVEEHGDH